MPFIHGRQSHVFLDGLDLSPYLNMADWGNTQDTAETTAFGASWKTYIAGTEGAQASFSGMYDPTMLDLENLIGDDFALNNGVLTYCPAGAAIGDDARLFSAGASGYAQSSPVGGVVAVKWTPAVSAQVGLGWVLHPYGADTNTTTGATRDDLAATATGWIAHLHVGAVSAGSWLVVLADASAANFSDGATVATFTAATGKTSQRILSASGTTALRRYVRYVATRTGGTAGDTITFQLSYSRNA